MQPLCSYSAQVISIYLYIITVVPIPRAIHTCAWLHVRVQGNTPEATPPRSPHGGMDEPLLDRWARAAEVGLKATGPLVYVPRASWILGWVLILLSVTIFILTIVTSILH